VRRRSIPALALGAVLAIEGCNDLPTGPADTRELALKAFNLADWTANGYGSARGLQSLDEIAAAGANAVVFIYTCYQSDRLSSEILADYPLTPSLSSLAGAVSHARRLDLEVILKIHVDVLDGTWRGWIDPQEPARWFASYRAAVEDLIGFSNAFGVDQFVIGTELVSTLKYEVEWRELLAAVRGLYQGQICYAASWDEIERVPFWEALDVIGVNFYFPVAERENPSRGEILAGWQPWLDRLDSLHERVGRNVVLTEIGYMSRDGAGMDPADYRLSAPLDLEEQADLYWAALQATAGEFWIEGICWWNWTVVEGGGPTDRGYSPRGKPALRVLESSWAGSSR
jgi:hypothetical protein